MIDKLKRSLVLLWLLSLAILGTIYLTWIFYPVTIDYFNLSEIVELDKTKILANFHQLMTYLLTPWVPILDMSDFPVSASGIKHFADVKWLFQLTQGIFVLGLLPSLAYLGGFYKTKTLWKWQGQFLVALLLPLGIGVFGLLVGFGRFFTLFHNILFPGDSSWLFNPQTDPVILILPAQFFLACFVLFFGLYEALMLCLWLLSKQQWRLFRKKLWSE